MTLVETLRPLKWTDFEKYETVQIWLESLAENNDNLELTTGTFNGIKTWFPRFIRSTIDENHPCGLNT